MTFLAALSTLLLFRNDKLCTLESWCMCIFIRCHKVWILGDKCMLCRYCTQNVSRCWCIDCVIMDCVISVVLFPITVNLHVWLLFQSCLVLYQGLATFPDWGPKCISRISNLSGLRAKMCNIISGITRLSWAFLPHVMYKMPHAVQTCSLSK